MNNSKGRSILVVDDTESNIDVLVSILGHEYDIAVALDGETALEIAFNDLPDLILLDIMMPGMNGYEVCRKLKDSSSTMDIPIIFLSALSEEEEKQKSLALGAKDYISKPLDVVELLSKVKEHLRG